MDLPKKFENVPELNDVLSPDDGSIWTTLKLHRTDTGIIIYNTLNSIQFDVDYSELQQMKVAKVGIVRWDKISEYLYGDPSLWYIIAQLNNVIDPISELPDREDLIYYIDPSVLNNIFRQIRI